MKIASYQGFDLIIQSRDHCDPHVHIKSPNWDVRILFSFWKDDVDYWDTRPDKSKPKAVLIESLRQTLMQPANLRRAREVWWNTIAKTCIDNKRWSLIQEVVVGGVIPGHSTLQIVSSEFDAHNYKTKLKLENGEIVEIEL